MKKTLLILTLLCSSIFGSDSYNYVTGGLGPLPYSPGIGVGHRTRWGQHGFDCSLNFSSIIIVNELMGNAFYQYHFKFDDYKDQHWYVGAGVSYQYFFLDKDYEYGKTLSPAFVLGKEFDGLFNRKNFAELQVNFPAYVFGKKRFTDFPFIYFRYGICF